MSEETVLLSRDEASARVLTLNRPDKLNAMNHALVQGLVQAVDDAHADETIISIIINAEGRAFPPARTSRRPRRAMAIALKKLGAISTVRAASTNSAREPTNRLSPPFTATS